jgi:hypothetical protein
MKSQNFEFLRSKRAVLADLEIAERYAHEDAASSHQAAQLRRALRSDRDL